MNKTVAIIGGGIAGLASAVFLKENDYEVNIYETSPKWGGRVCSYYDKDHNIYYDNGQHILAGWYENTFDYLKYIDSFKNLEFQKNLYLKFIDKGNTEKEFKCKNLPGNLSLLSGILSFKGFKKEDKMKFLKMRKAVKGTGISGMNAQELLDKFEQTESTQKYFWNPFILSVFNTTAEKVSANNFLNILRIGIKKKKNLCLVFSKTDLNELFIKSTLNYFDIYGVNYKSSINITNIYVEENEVKYIVDNNGTKIYADYYISAVPFYSFNKLLNGNNIEISGNLNSSAITSLHIFFKEDINIESENKMFGLIDSIPQWVFIKSKKHISVVISGSDFISNLTDKNSEEIMSLCTKVLKERFEWFKESNISGYKVIKEKRATFIPEVGSEKFRMKQETNIKNLYIAGDWTDTGLPSTIESAVKSAKICSELICKGKK